MWPIFVSCAPGLEALLGAEVAALGVTAGTVEPGGVSLAGDTATMMRINLHAGLATHVLVRIGAFEARHFSALVKQTARLAWRTLLPGTTGWTVRATCRRSKLYHSQAVAERVDAAVAESVGHASPDRGPKVTIAVRLDRDHCQISLDTSGAPLHRRGWRLASAKAPLREDLARALLVASGWDTTTALIDPFAGSGTIVIEAACMARKLAPGRLRDFAFEHTSLMDHALWDALRGRADADVVVLGAPILGRDRAPGALRAAASNAARAGVAEDVQLQRADLRRDPLPDSGPFCVVTNPPFGHRVAGAAAARVAMAERLGVASVTRLAVVAPVDTPMQIPGIPLQNKLMTDHGGTKVAFFVGTQTT